MSDLPSGPWSVGEPLRTWSEPPGAPPEQSWPIITGDGREVVYVSGARYTAEDEPLFTPLEVEATARLVAAAPDLYEALEEARSLLASVSTALMLDGLNFPPPFRFDELIPELDATLAKARGKS